jgi:hypothetical protein
MIYEGKLILQIVRFSLGGLLHVTSEHAKLFYRSAQRVLQLAQAGFEGRGARRQCLIANSPATCYSEFSCIPPITTIIGTSGDRRQFNEFLK